MLCGIASLGGCGGHLYDATATWRASSIHPRWPGTKGRPALLRACTARHLTYLKTSYIMTLLHVYYYVRSSSLKQTADKYLSAKMFGGGGGI